ncbi:SDR family oxidoreductase [Planctomyces sp. SH-PL62]|uniref:SDR family oxidoreductase n=1 Tax=Planctomyces sp. SH-PL62 TaxID=1636152 RepID=UPI0018D478DC|nr:SDR family oxidoreductase [Planctomyces sp. SH-PL62]
MVESRIADESPVVGVSPWLLLLRDELRKLDGDPLLRAKAGGCTFEVRHAGASLWILASWPSGARVAFCAAYAPGGSSLVVERSDDSTLDARLDTAVGVLRVRVELPAGSRRVLHWKTSLLPATDLVLPYWPRDVFPIDEAGDPLNTRGIVHAAQKGPKGGLLYASTTRPEASSFLYVQDFTSLNDYCEQTGASPADRVGGSWPELGFAPPTAAKPLGAGREVVLSDAYVLPAPEPPDDDLAAARQFLDLYAEIYLALPRPEPIHRDWSRRLDETLASLTHSPECAVEKQGHRYLLAYVGADDRPPESMVQLAVLVPLVEYARSRDREIPLIDALRANLPTFFDPEIGTVVRWLPGEERLLEGKEEHMGPRIMDSWYLYHTYLNLGRLGHGGDETAKRLFLDSIEYGVRVAQRFEYRWPVFYDTHTLEIIKAEATPGEGGENDVGAQYAHVMLLAWDLTGERRFLDEAVRSAQALRGLGFRLGYQFNNTSFGAGGLLRLWRETGDESFRDLSLVCLANLVKNFWLWECDYGHARHYSTFLGLPPLQDARYLAMYEELEVLAAFHDYLREAGDDVHPAARVLLPEYCKYLIDRAWYHYPSELPADVLAEKPRSGHLNRQLSIPLEDLYDGWTSAGTVGQEVYGAAAPFVFVTRHGYELQGSALGLHCNYPIQGPEIEATPRGGTARFRALGDRRCTWQAWVVADHTTPMPEARITVEGRGAVEARRTEFGCLVFDLPGDAEATLEWERSEEVGETSANRRRGRARSAGKKAGAGGPRRALASIPNREPACISTHARTRRTTMKKNTQLDDVPEVVAGKAVVVTGGTTGIGRAIALLLAARGARVLVFGRHEPELADAMADLRKAGGEVHGLTADVTKREDVARVFAEADRVLGGLDVLVNNAALGAGSIVDQAREDWEYVIRTNLIGYLACAQEAVTRMKEAGSGHIVNIGSMSADVRETGSSVYVATKAGIQGFSEALRKEVNAHGVKVTLIQPGAVGSDMQPAKETHAAKADRGEMLKAEDIAACVYYCLTQPKRCDVVEVSIRPHHQEI